MPIPLTSRYHGTPIYPARDAHGETHPTVGIRPSTPPEPGTPLFRHRVTGVESLEYLAWRYYGTSDAWWRIAEANALVFPLDLKPGATVALPAPEDLGEVKRTRRF